MNRMSNNAGIDLAAALWLAHDDYDYVDKPNYISVTTLIKPIRQIILGMRVAKIAAERPDALRIGFAYAGQGVERLTLEDHDVRLHGVLTEAGYQEF